VLVCVATGLAEPSDQDTCHLRLRSQATTSSDAVTLGDVLVFDQADEQLVEQIASQPVVAEPGAQMPAVVSHEQVRRRLHELGLNLSQVLLGGALKCEVICSGRDWPGSDQSRRSDAAVTPGHDRPASERTLAEVLRAYVQAELAGVGQASGLPVGTVELQFERAGQEFLRLTSPPWEFHISGSGRQKLGPREFQVTIRRDGQVQRRVQVFAQVWLVRPVVVARRPLGLGQSVRREDVGLETRVFEQDANLGLGRVEEVIGQQIRRFVPASEMIQPDAIKMVDLVVRSRPVTVVGEGPSVQVRLTGVALDSGGYGDTVRVRMGDARRERKVLRGVVSGLGTVRLSEGES
jgi:flagella basal body P-ring formation protein FlgA